MAISNEIGHFPIEFRPFHFDCDRLLVTKANSNQFSAHRIHFGAISTKFNHNWFDSGWIQAHSRQHQMDFKHLESKTDARMQLWNPSGYFAKAHRTGIWNISTAVRSHSKWWMLPSAWYFSNFQLLLLLLSGVSSNNDGHCLFSYLASLIQSAAPIDHVTRPKATNLELIPAGGRQKETFHWCPRPSFGFLFSVIPTLLPADCHFILENRLNSAAIRLVMDSDCFLHAENRVKFDSSPENRLKIGWKLTAIAAEFDLITEKSNELARKCWKLKESWD